MLKLEKIIANFFTTNTETLRGDKILLAISGGADSMALLYTIAALKAKGILKTEILIAHINHQLRGSSADKDECFVAKHAQILQIPIVTKRLDIAGFAKQQKFSIETAAREIRIKVLTDIAKQNDINLIVTAHHKSDNAETVIQRLSRGTGLRGLGGIWPLRDFPDKMCFARPMLTVTKYEITEYLKERNVSWRQDQTNTDCTYRRNFIRHKLIPFLQKQSDSDLAQQLLTLSDLARKVYKIIRERADKIWVDLAETSECTVRLNLDKFSSEPTPVKIELIRKSLIFLGSGEKDLTQGHYEAVLNLSEENINGKKADLPGHFEVEFEYDSLNFTKTSKTIIQKKNIQNAISVTIPGQTRFNNCLIEATIFEAELAGLEKFKAGKNSFIEWFDLEKIKLPLNIRTRQTGDYFVPFGMNQTKKVGKFLTNTKVPLRIRGKTLIVTDSEKIIWLWPIRISGQACVEDDTRKILQLQITDSASE